MEYNYKLIQNNINALMKWHGFTRKDLAAGTDTSERQVIRWLTGKDKNGVPTKIPFSKLQLIADFFDISINDLIATDINETITNDIKKMTRSTQYITEIIALSTYCGMLDVEIELNEDVTKRGLIEYNDFKTVTVSYKTADGKTIKREVSFARYEAMARRIAAHVLLEIKKFLK